MYSGWAYISSYNDSDSLAIDSLATLELEQDVELDNEGNPIVKPMETDKVEQGNTSAGNNEATEPKKKTQPQTEDIIM